MSDRGRSGDGPQDSWKRIAREGCGMAVDAACVIWLRSLRLAGGGKRARRELALMTAEKWHAHKAYGRELAKGRFGRSPRSIAASTLAFYGLWIRDNRRRLSEED